MPSTLGYEWPGTRKATISPDAGEIKWASGFLEGEGTFVRNMRRTKRNEVKGKTECVRASQVNKEPLERLLRDFGGRIILEHKAKGNMHRSYAWYAYGARARGILMTLYSQMSTRRKRQIRLALGIEWSKGQ